MALDFPSNPTDGQVFDAYIWSASKGVWLSRPQSATVATTSPVAPSSPNNGDIWINTTTGIGFVYYNDGNTSQWMEILSSAVPAVNEIMPSGTVVQTARTTAPSGWLLCQGQAISRSTYSVLFSAIGTTYGTGDGSTTFNLPNMSGRSVIGVGTAASGSGVTAKTLGGTGGDETITLTTAQIPAHNHTQDAHGHGINDPGHRHSFLGNYAGDWPGGWSANYYTYMLNSTDRTGSGRAWLDSSIIGQSGTGISIVSAQPAIQNTGGGGAHNNLQPYIVLNYMIKV